MAFERKTVAVKKQTSTVYIIYCTVSPCYFSETESGYYTHNDRVAFSVHCKTKMKSR